MSDLVADLLDEGLAEELGRGPAKVGKPSTLLKLNEKSRSIVAVDLSDSSILRAAVMDLEGEVLHRVHREFRGVTGENAVAMTEQAIAEAIAVAPGPLLGVGVGTPGIVTPGAWLSRLTTWVGLTSISRSDSLTRSDFR